jgi:hypothetical protein
LSAADGHLLAGFRCAAESETWAEEVENGVRRGIPWCLEHDTSDYWAIGLFADNKPAGVCSWEIYRFAERTWWVSIVAVRLGQRRNGYGLELKVEVLRRAEAAGIQSVLSEVAPDNVGMRELNKLLGAEIRTQAHRPYVLCAIAV